MIAGGITTDELIAACRVVYEPARYAHAPEQMFIDHFSGGPPTTFIRASFPNKFTHASACKLEAVRRVLEGGAARRPNIVFCIYFERMDANLLSRHAVDIAGR